MSDLEEVNQIMADYELKKMTDEEYKKWKRQFIFSRSKEQLFDIIEAVYG